MEDPTGGLWIYLIFLLIPLANKNTSTHLKEV